MNLKELLSIESVVLLQTGTEKNLISKDGNTKEKMTDNCLS